MRTFFDKRAIIYTMRHYLNTKNLLKTLTPILILVLIISIKSINSSSGIYSPKEVNDLIISDTLARRVNIDQEISFTDFNFATINNQQTVTLKNIIPNATSNYQIIIIPESSTVLPSSYELLPNDLVNQMARLSTQYATDVTVFEYQDQSLTTLINQVHLGDVITHVDSNNTRQILIVSDNPDIKKFLVEFNTNSPRQVKLL